jgi:cellulose synthase operon protein YhjU
MRIVEQFSAIRGFSAEYLKELAGRFINLHYVLIGAACIPILRLYNRMYRLSGLVLCILILAPVGSLIKYQWLVHQHSQENQLSQVRAVVPLREGLYAAENIALGTDDAKKLVALRRESEGGPANIAIVADVIEKEQPTATLQTFYKQQNALRVANAQFSNPPDFDILVLHVRSLSWDDLKQSNLQQHPVFKLFDVIFENFNSAANYSGPAAIRLLRAYCGQQPHAAIYRADPTSCHLFSQLADLGYQVHMQMNHDGRYESFADQVKANIAAKTISLIDTKKVRSSINSFDGTPIADDGEVLNAWWKERLKLSQTPVALYYNSISLHDGNRIPNVKETSIQTYPRRTNNLLSDMQNFINTVAQSKRRTLLVFTPEHGAALSGDSIQVEGLREIPTRSITNVPVGIKWIDGPASLGKYDAPLKISQSSSYTALAQLMSNWLSRPPLPGQPPDIRDYIKNLPTTRFVSDSGQNIVMNYGKGDLLQASGTQWKEIK